MEYFRIVGVILIGAGLALGITCKGESGGADHTHAAGGSSAELEAQKQRFFGYVEGLPPLKLYDSREKFQLVVEYLEDPALPTLTPDQLSKLLERTEKYAREYLKLRVKLRFSQKRSLPEFFEARRADFDHPVLSYPVHAWYIDLADENAPERIRAAIHDAIQDRPEDVLEQYFGPIPDDRDQYVRRIQRRFMTRLDEIYGEPDANGRPLFDARTNPTRGEQMSYAHWDTLLYQEKEVDFFLTNTALAGPDTGMPIYVINRGGITSGFVENNAHRPYQGVGLVAMYPMLSNGPAFTSIRGRWNEEEQLDAIAFMILHELGHLLQRKAENYTLEGSVHRAPVGLDYVKWVAGIKEKHNRIDASGIPILKKF